MAELDDLSALDPERGAPHPDPDDRAAGLDALRALDPERGTPHPDPDDRAERDLARILATPAARTGRRSGWLVAAAVVAVAGVTTWAWLPHNSPTPAVPAPSGSLTPLATPDGSATGNPTPANPTPANSTPGSSTPASSTPATPALAGTAWVVTSVAGTPVTTAAAASGALVFDATGGVAGSNGCEGVQGTYSAAGAIALGWATSSHDCGTAKSDSPEFRLGRALESAVGVRRDGEALALLDAAGAEVAGLRLAMPGSPEALCLSAFPARRHLAWSGSTLGELRSTRLGGPAPGMKVPLEDLAALPADTHGAWCAVWYSDDAVRHFVVVAGAAPVRVITMFGAGEQIRRGTVTAIPVFP